MDKIVIEGGRRLDGEVAVSGSKNAALPILISSLLTSERCVYQGVPHLADSRTTLRLLAGLGVAVAALEPGQACDYDWRCNECRGAL